MATEITEQIVREAPEIEAYKLGLLKSSKALAEAPPTLPAYEVAGLSEDQIAAIERARQGIGAYQPFLSAGQEALGQAMAGLGQQMQPIGAEQIQQYMNPYEQQVLQAQLDEMNRQSEIQRQNLQAQAIAQSKQQNYAQALAAAQQQQGQLAQMASQYGNLGIQQAALGQTAQQLGQQDVSYMYGLGETQQRQSQAELDALRASNLQAAMQPYQQLAFLSDIYKGAPSSQMTIAEQSKPTPSPFQQLTGLVTGGIGALAGAQKAGIL